MVKDSPVFKDVIADFYKYCDGYTFVAHNIEFDYKFIKFLASKEGYVFTNPGIDTYALSKSILPALKTINLTPSAITTESSFAPQSLVRRSRDGENAYKTCRNSKKFTRRRLKRLQSQE